MSELSCIEILFMTFLCSFLMNYYLLRVGNIMPYIEKEEDNFLAKLTGFCGIGSIILLLYSF